MHNLLVSLPQTPSLAYRRCHLSLQYISYKSTPGRPAGSVAAGRRTVFVFFASAGRLNSMLGFIIRKQ